MAIGKQLSDLNTDGTALGQTTSDKIAFYGSTPIVQRSAAALSSTALSFFTTTGASFVANTSTTVSGLFGFNSGQTAALVDALSEIRSMLIAYGLHKGGA